MSSPSRSRCHALYVEDSRDDQQILREAVSFADVPLDLVTAMTPEAALAILRAGEGSFDVLLLDWNLPKMNGAEFLAELRIIEPVLPVVVLTGEPRLVHTSHAVSLGVSMILQKPLVLEEWEDLARRLYDFCGSAMSKVTVPGQ